MDTKNALMQLSEIASRIKELRDIIGFTTAQMAEKTDITEEKYNLYESGKVDKNNKPIYEYHASIWKGNDEIWECMDPNGVRTRQYSTYYKWMNEHNHKINKVKYFRFKES